MDDIRYALKDGIAECRRVEFLKPEADIELEKGMVAMLGSLDVTVRNIGAGGA